MKKIIEVFLLLLLVSSEFSIAEAELTSFRQQWAILVGVSVYSDSAIEPLKAPATDDVKNMQDLLTKRGSFLNEHITALTDTQATYQGINEAFQSLLGQVKPDDLVVFYFSGRGTRVKDSMFPDEQQDGLDECLLPYDAVRRTKKNFLRDDEIGRYLKMLNSKRAVIIIDSCYSGTSDEEKGITTDDVGAEGKYLDGITQTDFLPPGSIVFEACVPEETIKDGVFTDFFTQFAESESDKGNGIVTLYEIYRYVKEKAKPPTLNLIGEDDAKKLSIVQPLLEIKSEPLNVEIFIDNKPVEAVRTEDLNILILPKGSYRIELRKRGYNVWDNKNSKIEIKRSGRLSINAGALTQVSVKGRIIYGKSRLPVHKAKVVIANTPYETTINDNGVIVLNDWSKYGPLKGQLEIRISAEGIKPESRKREDVGEFNEDISFGNIEVVRLVKISLTVTNATGKRLSDAQVFIDGQPVSDDNKDGIFEKDIVNPEENIRVKVSRKGYETKQIDITIGSNNSYSPEIQLVPAEHSYSIEVKSQYDEAIPDVVVKLNGIQIGDKTGQNGIVKGKARVVSDELERIELGRDGRVDSLTTFEIQPDSSAENSYKISVVMQVLQITVETVDVSDAPIPDVQILVDDKNITKTSDNGQARLSLVKRADDKVTLTFEKRWDSKLERMNVIIKILGEANFKLVSPRERVTQVGNKLVVKLPIPPFVSIKINVTDEKGALLPGMIVQMGDITFPGTTNSEGVIEVKQRMLIEKDTTLQLTFEKYGNQYVPKEKIKPIKISPNEYKATAVLPIQPCVIDINAHANIENKKIENMAIYAEIFLDGELRGKTLPLSIEKILQGRHELKITVMNETTVKSIDIDSGEHVSENIEIEEELVWGVMYGFTSKSLATNPGNVGNCYTNFPSLR